MSYSEGRIYAGQGEGEGEGEGEGGREMSYFIRSCDSPNKRNLFSFPFNPVTIKHG